MIISIDQMLNTDLCYSKVMNDLNDNELDKGASAHDPNKPVTPGKLGVYDRPERQGLSPLVLLVLVILALVVAYLLWQFVF